MMAIQFKPPETQPGDMRTPVTFYENGEDGFMPGETGEPKELFFCMAEMYDSSIKDYQAVNTNNAKYVTTLIIPNPREDYIPEIDHTFKVEDILYQGATFDLKDVKPHGLDQIKIVGVAYNVG